MKLILNIILKKSEKITHVKWCDTHICIYTGWWFQPLWNILVSWGDYSQYMENMFQTTNQYEYIYLYTYTCTWHIFFNIMWNHCRTQAPSAFGAPCHSADSPDVAPHWSWLQRRPALQVTSARGKMKALTVWPGEKWELLIEQTWMMGKNGVKWVNHRKQQWWIHGEMLNMRLPRSTWHAKNPRKTTSHESPWITMPWIMNHH